MSVCRPEDSDFSLVMQNLAGNGCKSCSGVAMGFYAYFPDISRLSRLKCLRDA